MKKLLLIFLVLFSTVANSATVHQVYNRLIKANGFIFYPKLVIKQDSYVQAWNRGVVIIITTGMLKYLKNDDELAAVLGHELAHGKNGTLVALIEMSMKLIGTVLNMLQKLGTMFAKGLNFY